MFGIALMDQPVGAFDGRFGRLFSVTTAGRLVAHAHPEWQFVFNLKGPIAAFLVENKPFPLSEGELLAIPPWTTHAKAPGAYGPCSMISLLVSTAWRLEPQAIGLRGIEWPTAGWSAQFGNNIRRLLAKLCASIAIDGDHSQEAFENYLARLLSAVLSERAAASKSLPIRARQMDNRIRKALDMIRNSEGHKTNLDDIARKVALSRSHFFKRFRECVGTSPLHAVNSARIAWAVSMLGETDEPIASLSHKLGFSTQGHFTRFFAQHLFIPPTKYREWLRRETQDCVP